MIKYFIFSRQQLVMKRNMASKLNQVYRPGYVFVGNKQKEFTDIIDDPKRTKFSDSIIVTSGEQGSIRYIIGSDMY